LIPVIKYLDAVYLISSLLFTRFRYTPLPEIPTQAAGFLEDDFKMGTTPDILGRKKYSVQIARGILDTQNLEKSFVLAINSPWGFGKSAFLAMIRRSIIPLKGIRFLAIGIAWMRLVVRIASLIVELFLFETVSDPKFSDLADEDGGHVCQDLITRIKQDSF
jgi:hypothetical protein